LQEIFKVIAVYQTGSQTEVYPT